MFKGGGGEIKVTNFDRIRKLNIDDMAILLDNHRCNCCKFYYDNINDDKVKCDLRKCRYYIKKWLNKEVGKC